MRLWTLQDEAVYDAIMKDGKYRCIASKSYWLKQPHFKEAYDWLVIKMEERIGPAPEGVQYPVWAYLKKPNKKECEYSEDEKVYRIEFEIDPKDVLVTHVGLWNAPINGEFCFDIPCERYETFEDWDDAMTKAEKQAIEIAHTLGWDVYDRAKKESWNMVICEEIPVTKKGDVQITFWELRKEQIKKVRIFQKGKPTKTAP